MEGGDAIAIGKTGRACEKAWYWRAACSVDRTAVSGLCDEPLHVPDGLCGHF